MSRFGTKSFSQALDDEFARLEQRIAELEAENEELRRKNAEYLGNWVAAQDLAYNRMVQALLDAPDGALTRARESEARV